MTRATFQLNDKQHPGFRRLQQRLRKLQGGRAWVKAGFIGKGPGGETSVEGTLTNAQLAAAHEFGVPEKHLPERPFVRPAFDNHRAETERHLRKGITGLYEGRGTVHQVLGLLGQKLQRDIRATVTEGPPIPPPNAPATLARKLARSSGAPDGVRTLVDTGRMVGSVTYEVGEGRQVDEDGAGGGG